MPKEDFNIKQTGINTYLKIVEEHNRTYVNQLKSMSKDPYICTDCKSTFSSDFYRCPECCKGYITLNK